MASPSDDRTHVKRTAVRRRGSYGLDAPRLLPILALLVLADLADGIFSRSIEPLVAAVVILACGALGFYASRRGKFVVWARLLDGLGLKGGEHVLDIGCGRGAVLLMAAAHLTTGHAVGIDLWKKSDQSGNAAIATRHNAAAEDVYDRVKLVTADMTRLPFAAGAFDVVLSSLAIHNVGRNTRDQAIEEAVRVLAPGGKLLIADLWATGQYHRRLAALGVTQITHRRLGWRMWWSGPWLATSLVSASKPPERPTLAL
jgi:arsenite methyltransferase